MNITDVRVSLIEGSDDQLLAFCTITFDRAFVVRDVRVINGTNGPFVAMPSRRVTANCGKCGSKNYLGSKFCAECGSKLQSMADARIPERSRGYIDIAHPINAKARETLEKHVIAAYQREIEKSERPEYQPEGLESKTPGDRQQGGQEVLGHEVLGHEGLGHEELGHEEFLRQETKPSPHWAPKKSARDQAETLSNKSHSRTPREDSREN